MGERYSGHDHICGIWGDCLSIGSVMMFERSWDGDGDEGSLVCELRV